LALLLSVVFAATIVEKDIRTQKISNFFINTPF
jgi:hypothetical protein